MSVAYWKLFYLRNAIFSVTNSRLHKKAALQNFEAPFDGHLVRIHVFFKEPSAKSTTIRIQLATKLFHFCIFHN